MFANLRALASRLMGHGLDPPLPPPEDPYAGVREPRKHGPAGRNSSVAVDEPIERCATAHDEFPGRLPR